MLTGWLYGSIHPIRHGPIPTCQERQRQGERDFGKVKHENVIVNVGKGCKAAMLKGTPAWRVVMAVIVVSILGDWTQQEDGEVPRELGKRSVRFGR